MTKKNILCSATIVADGGRTYKVLSGEQMGDGAPVFRCEGYNEEGQPSRYCYAVIQAGEVLYNGESSYNAERAENLALYGSEDTRAIFAKLKQTEVHAYFYPASIADGEKEGTELTDSELERRNKLNALRAKYRAQIQTATEKLNAWNKFQFFTKKDGKPFSIVSKNYDKNLLHFGTYGQAFFFYNFRDSRRGYVARDTDDFYCHAPETFDELRAVVENRKEQLQAIIDDNTAKLANIESESDSILALFLPVVDALKNAVCTDDIKEQLSKIYRIA